MDCAVEPTPNDPNDKFETAFSDEGQQQALHIFTRVREAIQQSDQIKHCPHEAVLRLAPVGNMELSVGLQDPVCLDPDRKARSSN